MKKFSKLFLSCAAVAAVTAAVATSAMAADKTLTASYSVDKGGQTATLTINCASQDDIKTLLVLKPSTDKTNITQDKICQIDQAADIATVKLPVYDKTSETEKGTYTVLMGGTSGDIYEGTFTIGGRTIVVGNVNLEVDKVGRINAADASAVLTHAVSKPGAEGYLTGAAFQAAAQCNKLGDTRANAVDAGFILQYAINKDNPELAATGVGKEIVIDD